MILCGKTPSLVLQGQEYDHLLESKVKIFVRNWLSARFDCVYSLPAYPMIKDNANYIKHNYAKNPYIAFSPPYRLEPAKCTIVIIKGSAPESRENISAVTK